ncbi:MAG: flippase [Candidatus Krumholzibacteriota bacterium]|nr:flippase [Candidatus Krumholzibacteriota bacterium]
MKNEGPVNLSTSKVISETLFVSAARVGMNLLKPIRGILLGRLLGPALYGILIIPVPYVQILTMLSNIGFNTAVIKLIPGYRQEGRGDLARMIYRSSAFMTLVLSVLWSGAMLIFARWLAVDVAHQPEAVGPVRIYALIIPFLALNAFYAVVYLATQKGRLRAGISVIYGLLNIIIPISVVLWKKDVTFILGGFLAAEIIGTVLFAFFFHRKILRDFTGRAASLARGMKEVFGFGFLFFFASLGWNIINSTDRIMVKFYLPSEELAFYGMAALVVTSLSIISATAGTALIPSLTAARTKGDMALFKKQIWNTSRLGLIALVPMTAVLFTLADDIYAIVLPRYSASASVLRILVFIGFIDIICRIAWASLVAFGSGGRAASAYIIAAAMNIVLNIFLIPKFGIEGAAYATISSFLVLALILQGMMSVVAGVKIGFRTLIHPLILAFIFPVIGSIFHSAGSYARVSLVLIPGMAIYIILASATGLIREEDLEKSTESLQKRRGSVWLTLVTRFISILYKIVPKR